MATRTPVDWAQARAEYEAGDSFEKLGARYGRSHAAMSKRARAEGWVRDAGPAIARQVAERVAIGKVAARNPEKREAAIEKAVDLRVEIVKKHQTEWAAIRQLVYSALQDARSVDPTVRAGVSQKLKDARQAAHAIALAQAGERRAWNITNDRTPGDDVVEFVFRDNPDLP